MAHANRSARRCFGLLRVRSRCALRYRQRPPPHAKTEPGRNRAARSRRFESRAIRAADGIQRTVAPDARGWLRAPPPSEAADPDPDASDAVPDQPHAGRFANVSAAEKECLARAVYFEARGEPRDGQLAVAQVVLNRAASGRWPSTICRVVNQGEERGEKCQFSFACWNSSKRALSGELWEHSLGIAEEVLSGSSSLEDMRLATHYHRYELRPVWRLNLQVIRQVGAHIFYADKPPRAIPAKLPEIARLEKQQQIAPQPNDGTAVEPANDAQPLPVSQLQTGSIAQPTGAQNVSAPTIVEQRAKTSMSTKPRTSSTAGPATSPPKSTEPSSKSSEWADRPFLNADR